MMSRLLGPSLESLFQLNGPFSEAAINWVATETLGALQFYHAHNIIHRDLKPANFLVNYSGPTDRIYLVDFGLARKFMNSGGHHIPELHDQAPVGTLRFMSKNVNKGLTGSRRDDVYSLVYVWTYLVGGLNWSCKADDPDRHRRIWEFKTKIRNDELIPAKYPAFRATVTRLLDYLDKVGFTEAIDYDYALGLFVKKSQP
jgi:serine/threonine protein kinase